MSEIKTPPATDAYREGWDRTFSANVEKGDSGESSVHALEIGFEGAPECLGDGIGRFPRGFEGPLGFVLPSVAVGVHGRGGG